MKRRDFLSAAAAAALAPHAGLAASEGRAEPASSGERAGQLPSGERARVASVLVPEDPAELRRRIDGAIAAIAPDGWAGLIRPDDRVAIKMNCLAGPRLSPGVALVDAIVKGIASAGVRRDAIVIFDRSSRELTRAGFAERREPGDVRCFGTDALAGGGYGETILEHRTIGSLFSRILTDHATALINVGVCKDHDLSGISAGAKNLYGLIHNPNRYHANACDPYLADLLEHPAVAPRLRLTVIDAVVAQCHGGPAFSPPHVFHPGKVLLTRDPLAADVIARDWIEAERARRGLPTLAAEKREPTWIATAAGRGIGAGDRSLIDLMELPG
jgi:uncharacterized protein (DUF362 family)